MSSEIGAAFILDKLRPEKLCEAKKRNENRRFDQGKAIFPS